ncbi:MAG: fumarylacetoacetate hydrolase family protein [Lentisphaeria bacterium]|nr:fumarylacetoacetate hydrolase family protein [Lentisphaeria bacterium]NQZ70772.1 fumarylacetoacetate hydrolase family protein [Lentisphaeria bacterium]
MKLIRFGKFKKEKPGVLIDGKRLDLSDHFNDWDYDFFNNNGLEKLKKITSRKKKLTEVDDNVRWGAPVARPGKVICVGLNYSDHAKESGMPIPKEPIIFFKAANTVVGPFDDVIIPRKSKKTDWEVELAIIIGKDASYLTSPRAAVSHIAGYCISHDVSEREFQLDRGGQWVKGKSCDSFNPLGPFLATRDEIRNVNKLNMWLDVNGKREQTGSTDKMIFNSSFIVHYLSHFMTLEAGDVISTGTPPGVGMGKKPPRYLKEGDVCELAIAGLGEQRQTCIKSK